MTDPGRRFSGIANLYSAAAVERFARARVCVIGIGGVGSWAAEALARSGIGYLALIDLDHVAESNINRQIHALDSTLGQAKVQAMRERILDINPDCEVLAIEEFIEPGNLSRLISTEWDCVIDCIDNFRTKAALIHWCRRNKVRIITVGAAGGQTDPTRIRTADLSRACHDALLARTRKTLRQDYGFPRNLKRRFCVPCVYSEEQARLTPVGGCVMPAEASAGRLNCAGGLGSVTPVTATCGFVAAARVLDRLAAEHHS